MEASMPKPTESKPRSSNRIHHNEVLSTNKVAFIRAPKDLSPQLKGIYSRVARQLGIDPQYVGQVARGESESALVQDALRRELTRILERRPKIPYRHEVQFYSDDTVLLDRLVPFAVAALGRGDPAIIVATKSHRDSLLQRLKTEELDVDAAIKAGMYVAVDAASTLSMFMVNDMPKSDRFFKFVGGFIEEVVKTAKIMHPRVAVFGEWVSLLWQEGKADAALRLEQLGSQLARTYKVEILCGYEMRTPCGEEDHHDFESICAEHSAIYSQGK
jgi:MEDS: MEthanogen/methylotroph, DcmR Sensory domain